jgi:hypothetical protein
MKDRVSFTEEQEKAYSELNSLLFKLGMLVNQVAPGSTDKIVVTLPKEFLRPLFGPVNLIYKLEMQGPFGAFKIREVEE